MGWFSREEKKKLALMGADIAKNIFQTLAEESKNRREKAMEDKVISQEEYDAVYSEMEEYRTQVENLLVNSDIKAKYRETQEIVLTLTKIMMYDLKDDYPEVIQSFTKFIDSEAFIEEHRKALELRQQRLDKEYEEALSKYEEDLKIYKKSKNILSNLLSKKEKPPVKPIKRQ